MSCKNRIINGNDFPILVKEYQLKKLKENDTN